MYSLFTVTAILFCFGIDSPTHGITRESKIVLDNNGYTNIVIAIDENVPEDANLIQGIKNTFTHASKVLYRATRRRAYFHLITILLPSTWSDKPTYGTAPGGVTYNNADVVIFNPVRRKRRAMYTRRYSGCGQPGIHIQLVSTMFTDLNAAKIFGPIDKMIVHEWGHFRWGLYDEYAQHGDAQYYFSPSTGQPEGIRCIFNMKGLSRRTLPNGTSLYCRPSDIIPETMEYPDGCEYIPYPARVQRGVNASFMYHQDGENIVDFCDDGNHGPTTEHNYEASSQQNRKCGHRSTWEVMLVTDDFMNNRNPPRDIAEKDLTPVFTVVKPTKTERRRRFLSVDSSGNQVSSWASIKNGKSRIETPSVGMGNTELINFQSRIDYDDGFSLKAVMYVDVRSGMEPITGLIVTATVIHPTHESHIISLYDNGVGFDAEKNDGVYTRSSSNFSQPGTYIIRCQVKNDQNRGTIRLHYTDENEQFEGYTRKSKHEDILLDEPLEFETNIGRLHIPVINSRLGPIPPSRISDLKLSDSSSSRMTVTLTWSAPGDDADYGKAFRYEVRVSTSVRDLLKNFNQSFLINDKQMDRTPTPKSFGKREEVVIDMSQMTTARGYAFAIVGVDAEGNRGDVSNVVTAGFHRDSVSSNDFKNDLNAQKRKKRSTKDRVKTETLQFRGIFFGVVFMGFIFGIVVVWRTCKHATGNTNLSIC